MSELVAALEHALASKALLHRLPDQPGDVPITFADISLAERELGYRCTTPVKDGLRRFVEWYRQQQQAGCVA